MTIEKIIDTLKMENNLILFNPETEDNKDIDYLNDTDFQCYVAHDQAIEILQGLMEFIDDLPLVRNRE